ncbi:hypothetical protein C1H46_026165 [Malus baccata]|uniref:Bromo domain-containing protein n=1 Tax=Malus baccata TaxID=106549 RepID=A0A540LP63_MALBA|nr:hypothetical protein C1H46_026165 [Malus baccata]
MAAEVIGGSRWGTWVELLLAGAILRYGTRNWNQVAEELRARTVCPYTFTPEVCKAKYHDLRKRYSGSKAWFEDLRKKRMEELRQALKQSEDSIGSLESKLKSLKAEKEEDGYNNYDSSQTESPVAYRKSKRHYPSVKEAFKDEPSAGSFTCEALASCSPECQILVTVSAEETETKREASHSSELKKISGIEKLVGTLYVGLGGTLRKRRGKRKRKNCSPDVKEGSIGECGFLDSADAATTLRCIENSTSECPEEFGSSGAGDCNRGSTKDGIDELQDVFNSISEHKSASLFRHRLDSQKRRRYKKLIRRHMDFNTIRSRIFNRSVMSVKELFRDLLLLANNALVFYSKNTREYKSALLLRDITTKTMRQHFKDFSSKATSANLSSNALVCNTPVKPRSARPGNRKFSGKASNAGNVAAKASNRSKNASHANADSSPSVESFAVTKKASCHPRKVGRRSSQQNVTPARGRKRGCTK